MATLATSPLRVKNGHRLIVQSQARHLKKKPSLERAFAGAPNIGVNTPWQPVRA